MTRRGPRRYRWFITFMKGMYREIVSFLPPSSTLLLAATFKWPKKGVKRDIRNDSLISGGGLFSIEETILFSTIMCNKSVEIRTQYQSSTTTTSVHMYIYILLIGLTIVLRAAMSISPTFPGGYWSYLGSWNTNITLGTYHGNWQSWFVQIVASLLPLIA